MRTLSTLWLMAVTATVTATACRPQHVVVDGREMTREEAAALLYQQGQQAASAGDFATAKAKFREVSSRFSDSPREADALGDLGAILYREGGCDEARGVYEAILARHGASPRAAEASKVLAGCGTVDTATRTTAVFDEKFSDAASPAEQKAVASDAADTALAAGRYGEAVDWLLKVHAVEEDPARRTALETEIVELVDGRVGAREVRRILEGLDGDGFPRDLLTYKLGRLQYHGRDLGNAKETLEAFVAKYPSSPHVKGAQKILALIEARGKVKPRTIGVLLPLSGKLKAYGENVRQAVRLAIGEFDPKKKDGPPAIEVVFRDSQGDPVATSRAVEDFVHVDGAVAIVGALFRVEAEAAAYKAQELGVPLLTVSSAPRITDIGPFVFRSGVTDAAQMDALVEYAMDVLGMKRFAVLHPRHPYGEELLHLFWERVAARRGEIRGVESYASTDTTFQGPVQRLVGRDALDLRGDYKRAVAECDSQPDPYRKARCKKKAESDLKPIVDFDGLFIPDYPRTLTLIAPALAFEDIIVEKNPARLRKIEKTLGRKVSPVTLLGASGWNSPSLPEKAERYVENAIFTDGFFTDAEDKTTVDFVAAFRREFKRTPILPDALFFDAVAMLRQVIETQSPASRSDLREALRRVEGFVGVTGKTSFRGGQDAQKSMRVLTIEDGRIKEAPPPSEKAPTVGGTPGG